MNDTTRGRAALRAWEDSKPDNFFTADSNLQRVLRRYLAHNYFEARFAPVGEQAATLMDTAAKVEDRIGNHPQLERWSGIGERVEQIAFHPHHDTIGQIVWESGIMALQAEPGHVVEQMGLFYLLNHNGEAGHMCSLACTAGLVRALQQVAADDVRAKFLPPLLEQDYEAMAHGAQFLTEVQGGSDVGANSVTASDNGDGTWRINGEKWFCSNINAQQFLMTARPEGAADGTKGLGLFLVPRTLADGRTNGFYIRRLKDKIGTRTLASAELDFQDALAYPVGPLDRGFKNAVEMVLNTSRLMNAVACAGIMRRAYIEACTYARHRDAFGQPIISYPLVQETLAAIKAEYYAAAAIGFYTADLLDRIESGSGSTRDAEVYRLLVNIGKYITSIRGTEMVHRAIEVLGGNGAIESFSILPRLYRDMIVLESWEGTHNVLCLQVQRDILRYGLFDSLAEALETMLIGVTDNSLRESVRLARAALGKVRFMLALFQQNDDTYAQAHARRFVDQLAHTTQAALLLAEVQWEIDNNLPGDKADAVAYFLNTRANSGYDPLDDDDYLGRITRLTR